jgi:hypothetical protein
VAAQLRAGLLQFQLDGEVFDAKGKWTYNLGKPKREAIIGADGIHGYKETPQVAFIEGAVTDRAALDLEALLGFKDGTATLQLANGKVVVLQSAWYAGEGTVDTDESEIAVRIEGLRGEEVPA